MRVWTGSLALSLGLALSGCGESEPGGSDVARGEGLCAGETRADTYAAGLVRSTEAGLFTVSFVEAAPAPPDRGLNRWRLEVKDATALPVDGAELRLRPWMPDHGHGSNPPYLFAAASGEPGRYELEDMDLFMSGFWQFTVRVTRGEDVDEAVFGFCIEG